MNDNGACSIPPQTFVECGLCQGSENITRFCKNCSISLCDDCAVDHETTQQYESHTVVPRTYTVLRLYGPSKIAEQCHIHPRKEISSYCNECDIPCCNLCLANNHQCHDFSTIEDKYLDAERKLNDYYRQIDTDLLPRLDKMEKEARVNKGVNIPAKKVIDDINEFRTEVSQNFNRACGNLISCVHRTLSKNSFDLKNIESAKENLVLLEAEIDEKLQERSLDVLKYSPPKLKSLVPKLTYPVESFPEFRPPNNLLEAIRKSIGKIQLDESKSTKNSDKNKEPENVQTVNSFKIDLYGAKLLTRAGDKKAWVVDGRSSMFLFNEQGEEIRSLKLAQSINGMAITQSGEIIISCRDKKVRRVVGTGKVSVLINTVPFECSGVYLTEKDNIVVCLNGRDDKNHVTVYSSNGQAILREVRGRNDQGKHLICYPYRVVLNGQDLCVLDDINKVVCVNKKDRVRWVYGGQQTNYEASFYPTDVCVDKNQNLLITDSGNDIIHYLDRNGVLIKMFMTLGHSSFKTGICVDDDTEHVWVGHNKGEILIAKYSNSSTCING